MTSKLIVNIKDQHDLRSYWPQRLDRFCHDGRSFVPFYGATVRPHLELGKLYFMGSGGNFNYEAAMKHIKEALLAAHSYTPCFSNTNWRNETEKDLYKNAVYLDKKTLEDAFKKWNSETINRIEILKNAHFDILLNRLRAEVLQSFDPELTQLFDTLWQASFDFVTQTNPDFAAAKKEFCTTTIVAIGNIHTTLVPNNFKTLLAKILGAIASICILGIPNYATGRSMYGLFSSRIDTAVKLDNLYTRLVHPKNNTTDEKHSSQATVVPAAVTFV